MTRHPDDATELPWNKKLISTCKVLISSNYSDLVLSSLWQSPIILCQRVKNPLFLLTYLFDYKVNYDAVASFCETFCENKK